MSDDGVISDIAQVAGDVGKSVLGEITKLGKSATSQVTGSNSTSSTDKSSNLNKKPQASDQIKQSSDEGYSFWDELAKIGKAAGGQVIGHESSYTPEVLVKKSREDKEFSQAGQAAVRQKIRAIYEEYERKNAQEAKTQQLQEQRQQQQVKAQLEELKKQEQSAQVNPAVAKTRAEIKNYGAE